ncbi:hypothetical protein Ahy_A01g000586 isoform A [Arachis hypogaea]|uniref:MULE transposase domain-containing protein n=1 Tax=Arachis hypogaea TaxID=3818 RepID=A0A445EKK8_ARAHY|nr:hypothetical protein Ahy_A01g000586 isoform A [Arachis hypogaea]
MKHMHLITNTTLMFCLLCELWISQPCMPRNFLSEGNVAAEDNEFSVRIEFGSRESVISAIKSYTISRGVDYTMYESKPHTFYPKCKEYGAGCDWLIRVSLIQKKGYWEIMRYNGKRMCTIETISQDHAKLDSDTIVDAIRSLVEADPSIKAKSIIVEVQSRFNYIVNYCKVWLANQKYVSKVFADWKIFYQTLPVWLKAMTAKMPISRSEEVNGVKVLHCVFRSFYLCITIFRHCKPLVQIDGTHIYKKYKGALLVAVAQDENQNIVPIAFATVESKTAGAWEFLLTIDGLGIISECHNSIDVAITHSTGTWSPPRVWHMFCIRHIESNFLRRFNTPYLHQLVNRSTTKTTKCLKSGVRHILDGAMRSVLRDGCWHFTGVIVGGMRNLPVTAIVWSIFYRLNKLFTRKSVETHEHVCNGFTYSEFAIKRIKENFRRAGNIIVNRFDRRNEMFEVCDEMRDGSIYTVNLVQRHYDCGHFQVEQLPCRHVLA